MRLSNFWLTLLISVCVLLMIVASALFGFTLGQENFERTYHPSSYLDCNNLSLIETSHCLRDYVNTFYVYNFTQRNSSLEIIKENGANCEAISKFYNKVFNELGFETKIVDIFPANNGTGHEFLLAYPHDLSSYVKMDGLSINEIKFAKV